MRRTSGLAALTVMLAVVMTPVTASADTLPAAAVISPTTGSQVAGFVTVNLSGTVAAGTDTAQRLQLYVDNGYKAEQSCVNAVTCTAAITWDTTTLVGQHTLQARLVTSTTSVMSPAMLIQVGDAPTASITSPSDGASVRGRVMVNVAGAVDALQPDAVQSLQLMVDGSAVASSTCVTGVKACLAAMPWNSTGLQGTHELQVALTSAKAQSALSPVVHVLANNPMPTAILTSPSPMSTVHGKVNVVTAGTVDPTQVDVGSSVELLVDGDPYVTVPCSTMSCPATFSWNTAGKAGIHTLQALFTTAAGRTASSPMTSVWVLSSSTVTLHHLPLATAGASRTASGRVTSADGAGISGAKVVISVTSSVGKGNRRATVVTDSRGRFTLPYTVVSNTTVIASALSSTHYSAGAATTAGVALPLTSCTMAVRVVMGAADRLTCQLGTTTGGTAIALQQLNGSRWQNIESGKASGTSWTATHTFASKGSLLVRVVLGASRDFGAVTGKPFRINVS